MAICISAVTVRKLKQNHVGLLLVRRPWAMLRPKWRLSYEIVLGYQIDLNEIYTLPVYIMQNHQMAIMSFGSERGRPYLSNGQLW